MTPEVVRDISPENNDLVEEPWPPWHEIIRPDQRLSDFYSDEFPLYCERFINYFPKGRYFLKTTYDPMSRYFGWPIRKSRKTKRTLALIDNGDFKNLTDTVERHLDRDQWMDFRFGPEKEYQPKLGEFFWLGLDAPKKISFNAIDFDSKRIVGYYRERDKKSPAMPVVFLPFEHLVRMKQIYDAFPNRIWCITSETLGLDIIQKHDRPEDTQHVQECIKRSLARIGQGHVEVHPMHGRCKRRPFGKHYLTITQEEVIDAWHCQLAHYENPLPTPSFRRIAKVLVTKMIEQWQSWSDNGRYYDVRAKLPITTKELIAEIKTIYRWLDDDCPDLQQAKVLNPAIPFDDPQPMILKNTALCHDDPHAVPTILKNTPRQPVIDFNLAELRNGNWVKGLEKLARDGLPCHDSVGGVCFEIAKWLWWVELYHLPIDNRRDRIHSLLVNYVDNKNNGFVTRLQEDQQQEVSDQLERCVINAEQLDASYREKSLELFALIRQKRQQGQYRRIINLVPLMDQSNLNNTATLGISSSSFVYLYSVGGLEALDAPLPQEVIKIINEHRGRNRLLPFATRLINLLDRSKGICRIPHRHLAILLGYEDRKRTTKYIAILMKAGLVEKDHYVRGQRCCGYWLTKLARLLMEKAKMNEQQMASA